MDETFIHSFDERDWSKAFMERVNADHTFVTGSNMDGWFANAIMRGYDEPKRLDNIFDAIRSERDYQVEKWGNNFDDTHTPADWWTFVTFYFSKALKSWKINPDAPFAVDNESLRAGLIKVATIVVAWIEAIDRRLAYDKGQRP